MSPLCSKSFGIKIEYTDAHTHETAHFQAKVLEVLV